MNKSEPETSSQQFSVIIPTLWKTDRIHPLLSHLDRSDWVGEILVIDNANEAPSRLRGGLKKARAISLEENIFVNPAWNLGVKEAKFENICVANDDIFFNDLSVLPWVVTKMNLGIIGMFIGNFYGEIMHDGGESFVLERTPENGTQRGWGWGCLYFVKKSMYVPIPDDLLIACGDDWLIQNIEGGAWWIKNLNLYTDDISLTSGRGEFRHQQAADAELFKTKYDKYNG